MPLTMPLGAFVLIGRAIAFSKYSFCQLGDRILKTLLRIET
ncbi:MULTISPECIES: hypothetical protein [Cyanophyceae]|nr:hypothetical protein [Nodosilinea sp. FACHB-131]